VKAGTVRALAVAAPLRSDDFPDVPTLKERGADVDGTLWTGVFAPRKTPPEIIAKLGTEFTRIARMPDVVARLKALGINPVGSSTAEFTRVLTADIARWGDVARSANIRIEP
jgi:tripartite-type tricarboxylate transporter receptor subunit TctC